MHLADIARQRLISHKIAGEKYTSAQELVSWMGALQAQDYIMVKWALGLRLDNTPERAVQTAIDAGEILRTHLLRPTWHLVSAGDIHWLLALTAPHVKAGLASRHAELGLTESVLAKSCQLIEDALKGGRQLTRGDMITVLKRGATATHENRVSHLLAWAELDGLICSGADQGGRPTYALLEERVPKGESLSREEALAALARKYFASHGPAALQDFAWWSGLPTTAARQALDMVKADFASATVEGQVYWYGQPDPSHGESAGGLYLLPAYDEWIISYRDRRAVLAEENAHQVISSNGVFRPVIVQNGQVIGLWKRTPQKEHVLLEATFFQPPQPATMHQVEEAARQYGQFLEKDVKISYSLS